MLAAGRHRRIWIIMLGPSGPVMFGMFVVAMVVVVWWKFVVTQQGTRAPPGCPMLTRFARSADAPKKWGFALVDQTGASIVGTCRGKRSAAETCCVIAGLMVGGRSGAQ